MEKFRPTTPWRPRQKHAFFSLCLTLCLALPVSGTWLGCTRSDLKVEQSVVHDDGGNQAPDTTTTTQKPPQTANGFPSDMPPKRVARLQKALETDQEFFGLYVLGKRAGDMWVKNELKEQAGELTFVTTSETTLNVALGEKTAKRQVNSERIYRVGGKGELLAFSEVQLGDGGEFQTSGTCSPQGVVVVVSKVREASKKKRESKREEMHAPASLETLDDVLAPFEVVETQSAYEGRNFNVGDDMRDKGFTLKLMAREKAPGKNGVEEDVFVLSRRDEDSRMETLSKVTKDGRTLEVRYGDVLTAKVEPQQMKGKTENLEVFASTKVVLGGTHAKLTQADRSAPSEVVFQIRGLPNEFAYLMPNRQITSKNAQGNTLLTVKAYLPTKKSSNLPVASQVVGESGEKIDLEKWLKPSISVDSDNPEVAALARKIVGNETDSLLAANKLSLFVYDFLEKAYGVSSDRASLVLDMKKGDCTEHALLFTALARAVGIPARRLNGLVYMDAKDGIPALYWHEWAEVFVGNEWVSMDPTFGQTVADAGHIAFGDESQRDVAALFGQLKVDVLSVAHPGRD